ncbi:hypothetical protein F66182_4957 [Fusarium sp. NRRL 66182]|nr:hypothetical protein F66182_4957 [Fusarium sp. NRRL 66182]
MEISGQSSPVPHAEQSPLPDTAAGPSPPRAASRFECFCGRSYLRKEHLRRHQAVHNEHREHVCRECNASFTRKYVIQAMLAPLICLGISGFTPVHHVLTAGGMFFAVMSKNMQAVPKPRVTRYAMLAESPIQQHCVPCRLPLEQPPMLASTVRNNITTVQNNGSPRAETFEEVSGSLVDLGHQSDTSPSPASSTVLLQEMYANLGGSWLHSVTRRHQDLVVQAFTAYTETFHPVWSVLQTPTIDMQGQSDSLSAIIILIGSYLASPRPVGGPDISLSIQLHDKLVHTHQTRLCSHPCFDVDVEPWPFENYQAILLTIIFATYLGREESIQRAKGLADLFATTLRTANFFSEGAARVQAENHFPGSYTPYRFSIDENRRRITAFLFKIDAHLALITQQPPALHGCELDVCLPSTFSEVNGNGLDVFMARNMALGGQRKHSSMASFLYKESETFGRHMLAEDVHIGLCGIVPRVWKLSRLTARDPAQASELQSRISEHLRRWRGNIQILRTEAATNALLRSAYHGKEEQPDHVLKPLLTENIALYHLLALLTTIHAPSAAHVELSNLGKLSTTTNLPSEAMKSILHAICIGSLYRRNLDNNNGHSPPVLHHARIIAREYIISILDGCCYCTSGTSRLDMAVADINIDLDDVIFELPLERTWLLVDGISLCACEDSVFLVTVGLAGDDNEG